MFHFKSLFGLLLGVLLSSVTAMAAGTGSSSSGGGSSSGGSEFWQRAERRESKRWTLAEWLAQKDRNRLMDVWLSMNSPSPYEFVLSGSYNSYQTETSGVAQIDTHTSYKGSFSAYAQFVGLSAEYENNQEGFNDLSGLFNLRLLGDSVQGSYLAVHYGLRTHQQSNPDVTLRQQFAQASIQMYVIKQFGFDGLYRYYMPVNDATLGDVKETLTEGGAFIDFKNFRVFGTWYKELRTNTSAGTDTTNTRTGIRSGVKIFF